MWDTAPGLCFAELGWPWQGGGRRKEVRWLSQECVLGSKVAGDHSTTAQTEQRLSGQGSPRAPEPYTIGFPGFIPHISAHLGIFHLSVDRELQAEDLGNFCPHPHPWKAHHKELCNPPNSLRMGGITP